MEKILSIYETELDPTSSYAQKVKKYREDSSTRDEKLIELISKIEQLKVFTNGFYLYLHKTKPADLYCNNSNSLSLNTGFKAFCIQAFLWNLKIQEKPPK